MLIARSEVSYRRIFPACLPACHVIFELIELKLTTERGTVRQTPEGQIRWTTFSIFHGEERWRSEGVQVGGLRSARGVLGNWFDKLVFFPHGPNIDNCHFRARLACRHDEILIRRQCSTGTTTSTAQPARLLSGRKTTRSKRRCCVEYVFQALDLFGGLLSEDLDPFLLFFLSSASC
jgi:hypothetical protein